MKETIEGNKLKWEKIQRGYHGNGQKWKLGDRTFVASRAYGAGNWYFFELPNINSGQQIYKGVGDFRSVLKKFKLFIHPSSK